MSLLRKLKIRRVRLTRRLKRFHKKNVFMKNQLKSPQRRRVRRKGKLRRRVVKRPPPPKKHVDNKGKSNKSPEKAKEKEAVLKKPIEKVPRRGRLAKRTVIGL